MANNNGAGIFIPMEDTGFTPITDKDNDEFVRDILKKNPNAAVVNPDILEGDSNAKSFGSEDSEIR